MSETAKERIYRTRTGELVGRTHPGTSVLAYAEGDELTDDDAKAWKQRRPADKQRRAPANKAAAAKKATGAASSEQGGQPDGDTGTGLQVNTAS